MPLSTTRSLSPTSILVTVDGVDYYQFLLDINENSGNGNEFLSLDDIVILISDTANQGVDAIPAGTTVWDMDDENDVVLMDYSLEPGSGDGDMTLLIPVADFTAAGADAEDFVYLLLEVRFGGRCRKR